MSDSNGVIRIGRKGKKKFAIGEDGQPFEVDVVVAWQTWVNIDESFRERSDDRSISPAEMAEYHKAAVSFVYSLMPDVPPVGGSILTTAEALDFIARLMEQYNEVADFFAPRSKEKRGSPDSTGVELRFSAEPD